MLNMQHIALYSEGKDIISPLANIGKKLRQLISTSFFEPNFSSAKSFATVRKQIAINWRAQDVWTFDESLSMCLACRCQNDTQLSSCSGPVWELIYDFFLQRVHTKKKPFTPPTKTWIPFVSPYWSLIATVFIWRCWMWSTFHQQSPSALEMSRYSSYSALFRCF